MFLWSHGEKIIFLDFSGFGMQIEGGQNMVSRMRRDTFFKKIIKYIYFFYILLSILFHILVNIYQFKSNSR